MPSPKKKENALEKIEDLRKKSMDELVQTLMKEQDELMRARFQHATATLSDTALLKMKRRQIARIQTIMNEKLQRI